MHLQWGSDTPLLFIYMRDIEHFGEMREIGDFGEMSNFPKFPKSLKFRFRGGCFYRVDAQFRRTHHASPHETESAMHRQS